MEDKGRGAVPADSGSQQVKSKNWYVCVRVALRETGSLFRGLLYPRQTFKTLEKTQHPEAACPPHIIQPGSPAGSQTAIRIRVPGRTFCSADKMGPIPRVPGSEGLG